MEVYIIIGSGLFTIFLSITKMIKLAQENQPEWSEMSAKDLGIEDEIEA